MKKLVFLSLLILFNCKSNSNSHFDSKIWETEFGEIFITYFREKMIPDILESDTFINLSYKEIIDLLGDPEREKEFEMEYLIREKYEWNIDPEYISYLKLHLDSGKKVVKCEILK